ncbi:NERD domain-containing protein [Pseudalkalibacillus decolorationis]|uniref:NERD domain-containing protein n=1 Tax=Pseudalkalibacillus decolorationis TaxID=163879 RepID=UPI002147C643|nr:NERD domain-containing protein [Pseudalkalibacillus decolorationis]
MIKKDLQKPFKVKKLEALLRRLPSNHPKTAVVERSLTRGLAGYRGEQSLEYYLNFLPDKVYYIFHGLRIPFLSNYFQMDVLIVTCSFFLIIEVKNISGTLIFDPENNQLIRQYDGKEEIFPDPVQQVKYQKFQLSQWIKCHNIPQVPIETLVVITNSASKTQSISPDIKIPYIVIRSTILLERIEKLKTLYRNEKLTNKEVNKLSKQLNKQHTENDSDILSQFQVSKRELLKGVYCPVCVMKILRRKNGKWFCPECFFSSKDAHKTPLDDFALLISPTITNQQLRDFLYIKSDSTAKKIFHSMNLRHTGFNKGRIYYLREKKG